MSYAQDPDLLKLQVWKTDEWLCFTAFSLRAGLCNGSNKAGIPDLHWTPTGWVENIGPARFPDTNRRGWDSEISSSDSRWFIHLKGFPPVLDLSQGLYVWPSSIIAAFGSAKIRAIALRKRPHRGEFMFKCDWFKSKPNLWPVISLFTPRWDWRMGIHIHSENQIRAQGTCWSSSPPKINVNLIIYSPSCHFKPHGKTKEKLRMMFKLLSHSWRCVSQKHC